MTPTIRYMLVYGLLSGLVISALVTALVLPDLSHGSVWLGYLVMLVALTFVFVGVKRYRDVERGGVIGFGRAFGIGAAIAVIAGLAYVITWEIYLAATGYTFMADYARTVIAAKQAAGASAADIALVQAEMATLTANYRNPLYRTALTFAEIAPVGLLVALVSAALLRDSRVLPARARRSN